MGEEGRREMCGFEGHGYVLCTIVHSSTDPLLFSRVTEEPDTPLFTVYCSYLSTANVATLQKNTKLQNNNMHHYTQYTTHQTCVRCCLGNLVKLEIPSLLVVFLDTMYSCTRVHNGAN